MGGEEPRQRNQKIFASERARLLGNKGSKKRAQLGRTQSRGGLQLCERLNGAAKCKFAALNKRTHTCVGVSMGVCVFVSVCASVRAF